MILKGKIALVTGGSSGIGLAIAKSLSEHGCTVIATYNTHAPKEVSPNIHYLKADFHNTEDINQLFLAIQKNYDHLDILVNNAGINRPRDLYNQAVWQEIFQINLFAPVQCIGKAIELMSGGGKIINITSLYGEGKACDKELAIYGASKAALNHFTLTMAKKYAPRILITAVAPGYVRTPLWGNPSEKEFEDAGKEQLINRMIKPEEVASIVVELAKNDAITGEIIVVDGGLSLKTV